MKLGDFLQTRQGIWEPGLGRLRREEDGAQGRFLKLSVQISGNIQQFSGYEKQIELEGLRNSCQTQKATGPLSLRLFKSHKAGKNNDNSNNECFQAFMRMCQALFSAGGSQSVVPRGSTSSVSPGNVLEKQTLSPHLRLTGSDVVWLGPNRLGFSKFSMILMHTQVRDLLRAFFLC